MPRLGDNPYVHVPFTCSRSSRWGVGGGAQGVSPVQGLREMIQVPSTVPGAFPCLAIAGQCLALPYHPHSGTGTLAAPDQTN